MSSTTFVRVWLLVLVTTTASLIPAASAVGQVAGLSTPSFNSFNHTHRQDLCHRFDLFRSGSIELRDALSGLQLNALVAMGNWLDYDEEAGLAREDPGLLADLMDALAERANFTWRQSFGVMKPPEDLNKTWTEMLMWGIENYDITVNAWDQTAQRMEKGAAYIEPWFDGSLVLIDQKDPPVDVNTIIWFNWMFPFEDNVWYLIVFTILLSALVFQFIEYMHDEREERPLFQWFSDNLYMSSLNFSQNFEYAPNSVAGRIFGVSMCMWALVMTATYTANLASLFVQDASPPLVVDSIDQAIALSVPICTWSGTNSDVFIQTRFPKAKRVPKPSEKEQYEALRRGECGLLLTYKDDWLNHQLMEEHNPNCDLQWVGRVIEPIRGGFAVKADAGHFCTSLIRQVLSIHMMELISQGALLQIYSKHRERVGDQDCEAKTDSPSRHLGAQNDLPHNQRRRLKGGGKSAAAAAGGTGSSSATAKLTVRQMLGTFAFHWAAMGVAILVCITTTYYEKWGCSAKANTAVVKNRCHGPVIGRHPRPNTRILARNFAGEGSKSLILTHREAFEDSLEEKLNERPPFDAEICKPFHKERPKPQGNNHDSTTTMEMLWDDEESESSFYGDKKWVEQNSVQDGPFPAKERCRSDIEKLQQDQQGLSLQVQDLAERMKAVMALLQDIHKDQQDQKKHQSHSKYTDSGESIECQA